MTTRLLRGLFTALAACFTLSSIGAQTPPAASVASDYRLGSGDQIRITVFQNPDLNLETRVSESGFISFPLLGQISIGGLTTGRAEIAIADSLRKGNFVKEPQVSILVVQVRGNLVSVLGQVNRPGRYAIEVSNMRLSDMLANAGGIATAGSDTVVLVGTRNGQPYRAEIDLPKMFSAVGLADDVVIQNGDVIWVDRTPLVYVYGEVQRPGTIALVRSMTVRQALAASGGLTQRGTEKGLRIYRKSADGKPLIVEPDLNDALSDGDVVYVRESLF